MRLCVLHLQLSSMVRPIFRYGARAARSSALYKAPPLPRPLSSAPSGRRPTRLHARMRLCVLHLQLSSMVRALCGGGARAARSSALYKAAQLRDHFPPLPVGGDRRAYTPACACACCIYSSLRWSARFFVMAHGPREVRPYIKPPHFRDHFPPLPVGGDRRAYTPACACACCIYSSL